MRVAQSETAFVFDPCGREGNDLVLTCRFVDFHTRDGGRDKYALKGLLTLVNRSPGSGAENIKVFKIHIANYNHVAPLWSSDTREGWLRIAGEVFITIRNSDSKKPVTIIVFLRYVYQSADSKSESTKWRYTVICRRPQT